MHSPLRGNKRLNAKRVEQMVNKQPKVKQIKRLFEMNKIADYSQTKITKAINTESNKKEEEALQYNSVNFNLNELEKNRLGPQKRGAEKDGKAFPNKKVKCSLKNALARHNSQPGAKTNLNISLKNN